jgi:tetratricopeptide (TPR) repeat protein
MRAQVSPSRYAYIYYERAAVSSLEKRYEDARRYYNAALAIMSSIDETYIAIQIKNGLADLEYRLGNPRGALAIAEEIVAATHSTDEEFPYLTNVCGYRIALGETAGAKGCRSKTRRPVTRASPDAPDRRAGTCRYHRGR